MLKASRNRYFYGFSTFRNQQVAGSSPATSSTKPVKIERFSPVFSFICSDFRAANLSDPHGEMSRERRRGYAWYSLRRSVFFAACSHHLCHIISHLFGCAFLHLACDVGVGAKRESRVEVTKHTGHSFHVYAILERQRCECVPLRYNYDKPEKPRISRVFGYLARFFILFQTEKSSREVVIS